MICVWPDSNAHAAGFSTAWPPNYEILRTSLWNLGHDLSHSGINQKFAGLGFAAIKLRKDHPGGVNTMFGDGSVKFIRSAIIKAT
jgi:prepilin-type processing-associated H-X9-DG protein